MSLKRPTENEKQQWVQQYQADLVRYANRLETADLSQLNENVQNMIVLLMARWTATRELEVRIPLDEFRQRMHLTKQRNKYIKDLCKSSYGSSVVELNFPDGSFCITSLIDRIGFKNDCDNPYIYAIAKPEFMPIFNQLQNRYTQYMADTYLGIKGQYDKNLFRIMSRKYKGHFEIDKETFVHEMGLPKSYNATNIAKVIDNAKAQLELKGLYINFKWEPIIGRGRGCPVVGYKFSYDRGPNLPDISKMRTVRTDKEQQTSQIANNEKSNPNSDNGDEKLICPYCQDRIVRSLNRNNNTYFYRHEHWEDHRKCPLKNCDTKEEMLNAINDAQKSVDKKRVEKQRRQNEKTDLPEDFDPNDTFQKFGVLKNQSDLKKITNSDFELSGTPIDIVHPEPFPKN